jgi:GT2 family glycosyltransferase
MGKAAVQPHRITVVIPTFGREEILIDTLNSLLLLDKRADEIIIVDQTPEHHPETMKVLQRLESEGTVRWLRLELPSIPHAMNTGLLAAAGPIVLFLDDDIIPHPGLIAGHMSAWATTGPQGTWCIAGQVLQPGEEPIPPEEWRHGWFPFHSNRRRWIGDVMAGNLSVDRQKALSIGGFDENFVGSAYRFESEFARRVMQAGGKILFEPGASIRHLRAERGGTRSYGRHLTTWKPHHSVGKYYFAFRGGFAAAAATLAIQPLRAVRTRYHLRHPWRIPATLVSELLGILWAARLYLNGPRFAGSEVAAGTTEKKTR